MPTGDDILVLLDRELASFAREIAMFPDDGTIWRIVPGVTNSAANLALHVSGNLQHYVGAVLGATGYVRNRELEFGRRSGTRSDVIAEIGKAADVVRGVLPRMAPGRMADPFPEAVGGVTPPTGLFLLHLAVHLSFHLGQAGYLRRVVTAENTSSGAISAKALARSG